MDTPHSFPTQPLPRPDACWIRLTQEDETDWGFVGITLMNEADQQCFYAWLNANNAGRVFSTYYAWEYA